MLSDLDADVSAHLVRSGSYRELSERLAALEPRTQEGAIIFAFYASLHLVQAYLLTKGERFVADNHGARRAALKRAPELRPMLAAYELLQARSESVRYDPRFVPSEADVAEARQLVSRIDLVLRNKLVSRGYRVP